MLYRIVSRINFYFDTICVTQDEFLGPDITSHVFNQYYKNEIFHKGPVTVCQDICPDQHLYAIGCIEKQG